MATAYVFILFTLETSAENLWSFLQLYWRSGMNALLNGILTGLYALNIVDTFSGILICCVIFSCDSISILIYLYSCFMHVANSTHLAPVRLKYILKNICKYC